MTNIKHLLANIKEFITKPDDLQLQTSAKNKLKFFLFILVLDIAIAGLLSIVVHFIIRFVHIDIESNLINQMLKSSDPKFVLFIIVIMAPLIEELIFRFFLRYDKMFPLMFLRNMKIKKGISKDVASAHVRQIWDRYFPIVFYAPLIIFSLIHIFNYQISTAVILLMPLLVLPQLLAGIFFGYIRVRLNFLSAILIHGLHNLLFVGIVIFQMYSSGYYDDIQIGEIHNIENENYSMVIEEIIFSPNDESEFHVYPDLMKFKAVNASILALNAFFIDYLSKDTTLESNKTYELLENDVMNRISNKEYNIDYNPKREYEHHLDTIVSVINKTISTGVGRKTKYERMKVF